MALATLSIDIVAKLASLEAGMDRAGRIVARSTADIERRFAGVAAAGRAIGASLVGAFAGVSLVGLVKATATGIDALNDVSDATGSSVENLSALEDVAVRTGTTLDSVQGILVKFNAALKEADGKNAISQALKQIGLDADELRKLDPAEALRRTAVALAGFADDGNKARLEQELFSKSVREAAPFLKDLAEQQRLQGTVTKAAAEEAEAFNKQLFGLQKNTVDLARELSGPLLAGLNDIIGKFREAKAESIAGGGSLLDGLLGNTPLAKLQAQSDAVRADIDRTVATVERLQEALDRKGGAGSDSLLEGRIAKARERLSALQRQALKTSEQLRDLADLSDGGVKPQRGAFVGPVQEARPSVGVLKDTPKEVKTRAVKPLDPRRFDVPIDPSLQAAIDRLEQTDVVKITSLREELRRLLEIAQAGTADGAATAEAINDVLDKLAKLDPAAQEAEKRLARINTALSATDSAQLQAAIDLLAELKVELAQTFDPTRALQLNEAIVATQKNIDDLKAPIKKVSSEFDDFAKRAAANIQDELAGAFLKVFKGEFNDIGKSFGDLLLRLAAQAQAAQLGKALFGSSLGGEGSGLLGQAASAIGAFFGGGRAVGGPVSAGSIYEVVERGDPELLRQRGRTYLLPGADGTVEPVRAAPQARFTGAGGAASQAPAQAVLPMIKVEVINNNAGQNQVRTEQRNDGGLRVIIDQVRAQLGGEIRNGQGLFTDIQARTGASSAATLPR